MVKSPEQFHMPEKQPAAGTKEQEKRARLISRYIESIIRANKSASPQEEKEIEDYYKRLSVRERADVLYDKLTAHMVDKQADAKAVPDPYLISEIRVLFGDGAVKELFSAVYGQARVDAKRFRVSELGQLWQKTGLELSRKEETYREIGRNLHLNKITGRGNVSSARSRLALLAENINALEMRRQSLETLHGLPETADNTDAAAHFQYEELKEYRRQMLGEGKFVWLPSRKEIHQQTVSAILNHRWPVLIGEAGTGKSQQANAAALELTGHLPTRLKCESTTGEKQMLEDIAVDPETGGSYKEYGPLMQAFTGFEDSRQKTPSCLVGRICDFEESGRLGPRGYSIIKEARLLTAGDKLNGKPVLPGAGAIWTTNPVGPRYQDRYAPDPAMRRELAEIRVDYPEMSEKDPELYEFALTALLNENNLIAAAREELAPAYEKKEIPEDKREALEDGSIVIARDEIIKNAADARHGALWRFTAAIKALQDSFVYGNAETEKYPDNLLRFEEDDDGKIEITADGGKPLTLSTSTVTLGELASWMSGFNERRQKRDAEFRTGTLTEWLNFKINTYLKQADNADKEKLRALFGHFGFLKNSLVPDILNAEPLTPKKIGYLSPRVPRPAYLEKKPGDNESPPGPEKPLAIYETKQVLLESGARILINNREFMLKNGKFDLEQKKLVPVEVAVGAKFKVGGRDFVFSGVIEEEGSERNGEPVGRFAGGEDLYKVFKPEELDFGILAEFASALGQELKDIKKDIEDLCPSQK